MAIATYQKTTSTSGLVRRYRHRLRRWSRHRAAAGARTRLGAIAKLITDGSVRLSALKGINAIKPILRSISHLETGLQVVITDGRRRNKGNRGRPTSQTLSERDRLMARLERLERDNARLVTLLSSPKTGRVSLRNASAHDLKTPLCTLESILDTLVAVLEDEGDRRQAMSLARLAELSSTRMRKLVNDILDQDRHRDATDDPAELVDMTKIVADAVERQQRYIKEHGITVQIAGSLPVVHAPKRAVTAVVNNLLENAVKYMGCGRVREIHVGSEIESGRRTIWIEDTGCGFDPARIEEAFRPYVRCTDDADGTGLGLAIVKKAVEGWGGSVRLDTRPGRGTAVRFSMPSGPYLSEPRSATPQPAKIEERA